MGQPKGREGFEKFMVAVEPRLRVALIALYGPDRGRRRRPMR